VNAGINDLVPGADVAEEGRDLERRRARSRQEDVPHPEPLREEPAAVVGEAPVPAVLPRATASAMYSSSRPTRWGRLKVSGLARLRGPPRDASNCAVVTGSARAETYLLEAGKRNAVPHSGLSDAVRLAVLAFVLVAVSFLAVARAKIDLRDEGYLWYGAIAVAKGQVPMRDFQSYDPGRYYWAAPWLMLLDHGIVPLRLACSAFHFLACSRGYSSSAA